LLCLTVVKYDLDLLDILSETLSAMGLTLFVLAEKDFKIKALGWLENAILMFDFADTVFHKSHFATL